MMRRMQVPGAAGRAPQRNVGRAAWWVVALIVALVMAPVIPVSAAPAAQTPVDATTLALGQYASAEMVVDDVRAWVIDIPQDGVYLISAVDEVAAEDFDIVVTDAAGNVLLDDVFETTELALPAGPVTLEFYAVADNTLAFVVLGRFGSMSTDEAQPGRLVPGGVYVGDELSEPHYGRFTIAPTAYPQQVLVYVEAGEGDVFYASIESDDVFDAITTDEDNLMTFWTHGGDYTLYLSPYDRRSNVTVIIFLAGPPRELTIGEEFSGSLPAGVTEVIYALPLEAPYTELRINVDFEADPAPDFEVQLFDRYRTGNVSYSSYGENIFYVPTLFEGVYYLAVRTYEAADTAQPFTIAIEGDVGRPTVNLTPGSPYADEALEGDTLLIYRFEISRPGAEVTVSMIGPEESDFDLYVGLQPTISLWSDYRYGSTEQFRFMAPVAGTYFAGITTNGSTGEFSIVVEEGDLVPELPSQQQVVGTLEPGERILYRLETTKPGQIMTAVLVGSEGSDFDLRIQGYDITGNSTLYTGGFRYGAVETAADIIAEPGIYEVTVVAYGLDEPATFVLEIRLEDPAISLRQWAVDAVASSQYGDDGYSARQAAGEPNTLVAGDVPTAWAPRGADDGLQTLELIYAHRVVPGAIRIVENYNPGAVVLIEAYDAASDTWVVLWEGEAGPIEEAYRIFAPELTPPDFATDRIRLTLDTDAVSGWNEIDAVQLLGRP